MKADQKTEWGPNIRRLIAQRIAQQAIPDGGGMQAAVSFLSSKESIIEGTRKASEWVKATIEEVRRANDPNPWRNASDEEIAAEICRNIKER